MLKQTKKGVPICWDCKHPLNMVFEGEDYQDYSCDGCFAQYRDDKKHENLGFSQTKR